MHSLPSQFMVSHLFCSDDKFRRIKLKVKNQMSSCSPFHTSKYIDFYHWREKRANYFWCFHNRSSDSISISRKNLQYKYLLRCLKGDSTTFHFQMNVQITPQYPVPSVLQGRHWAHNESVQCFSICTLQDSSSPISPQAVDLHSNLAGTELP